LVLQREKEEYIENEFSEIVKWRVAKWKARDSEIGFFTKRERGKEINMRMNLARWRVARWKDRDSEMFFFTKRKRD